MRVLQLIDSLEPGGAERMAVNYANSLSKEIEFSALVATRKEGDLKHQLAADVTYLFLGKRTTADIKAVLKLRKFIKQHHVRLIHAHSSSFFLAFLVKLTLPKLKIIWHDHYGKSEFLDSREDTVLKFCSFFFSGTISVNQKLLNWTKRKLNCKNAIYLSNFVSFEHDEANSTILKGTAGKRIVCIANLRNQKNHFRLLAIAEKIKIDHPDWTFHLIGKDFLDHYSKSLKVLVKERGMENTIYMYGSKNDIRNILQQSEIAILTSDSEGLPVAILEYGFYSKSVISTDVGQVNSIISHNENGFLIKADDENSFAIHLEILIENPSLRTKFGDNLKDTITSSHTADVVIGEYLKFIKK
jgi:glycosyltransferase involved in cell wall biosynthesis